MGPFPWVDSSWVDLTQLGFPQIPGIPRRMLPCTAFAAAAAAAACGAASERSRPSAAWSEVDTSTAPRKWETSRRERQAVGGSWWISEILWFLWISMYIIRCVHVCIYIYIYLFTIYVRNYVYTYTVYVSISWEDSGNKPINAVNYRKSKIKPKKKYDVVIQTNYYTSCDPHHDMSGSILPDIFSGILSGILSNI